MNIHRNARPLQRIAAVLILAGVSALASAADDGSAPAGEAIAETSAVLPIATATATTDNPAAPDCTAGTCIESTPAVPYSAKVPADAMPRLTLPALLGIEPSEDRC